MKQLFFIIVFISCSKITLAQQAETSNTYAIIIGVAKYLDADIPQLQFSNRDAVAFADYLMSASGGKVPKNQIRLLTDSAATIGEVDKALRWVLNNCKENDRVYFYFSGHGEMENFTMSKNGYLICYNTPSVAFVNMGLSIDYLNDMVNTLSVRSKAKVIVITDACHSGTQAGSKFKGNFFVGEQLMLKKQNEIRMASSKPDQLSNEKTDWGGGRGVFSYYLLNGLQGGLADADNDKIVNVGELKKYLEQKLANDPVLKNEGDVQTPVINGDAGFRMSKVVEEEAKKIQEQAKIDSLNIVMVMNSMAAGNEWESLEPDAYFFSLLKLESLEAVIDSLQLNRLPVNEIAFSIIRYVGRYPLIEAQEKKLADLAASLKNDPEKLDRFNLDLASAFLDAGQAVITNYISGDEAELERRRYYNSRKNNYDVYVRMFEVAYKLSQSDKYYGSKAKVLFHYFSGLALRIKIPLTKNPEPLIEQAMAEQNKALALEEFAAYIYNELGVLYQFKNNLAEAEKFYTKATQLSPAWAIPQSNLSGIFINKKDYQKAMAHVDIADSLQKNLQSVNINRGYIHEKQSNLLFAEEDYRSAIDINSRHFAPFERLGHLYMNTTNYAMADSFFYEADLRKRGYHFTGNDWDRAPANIVALPYIPFYCKVDPSILKPTDIFAFFTWGVQVYREKKYTEALNILKLVVVNDKTNPLVFHYMGKIYYDQQKWEEAELMFKYAVQFSKNETDFKIYVDSVKRSVVYPYDHACFEEFFNKSYYGQIEDHYFAGTIYEQWKHFQEAEMAFKKVIEIDSAGVGGYLKLWNLYEAQGRFTETEAVMKNYAAFDKERSDRELNELYRRIINRFPDNGDWHYRLGTLLYNRASAASLVHYFDSIVYFPLLNKEIFIDRKLYKILDYDKKYTMFDLNTTGSTEKIILNDDFNFEGNKSFVIPGTLDRFFLNGPIYFPRMDGIYYLQQAAELLSEKETLADIHFKTGNIYLWAGSKKQAYPYFERSLSLVPVNANARLTLIDIYKALYKNRKAFGQLNYLYDSSQINFEKRLLLAQFNIYAGQYDKASLLLNKTDSVHPYILPDKAKKEYRTYILKNTSKEVLEITNLKGLSKLLEGKINEAINFYKKSMAEQELNTGYSNYANYTLARLYAKTGNANEAFKYLQLAIKAGFNYSFILENDSYIESLRKTPKWQTMINGMSLKKYKKD